MKSTSILSILAASASAASYVADERILPSGASITLPRVDIISSGVSIFSRKPKPKDNWGNAIEKNRKKITIRASKHDRDDVSDDFLWAIKQANNGGMVHLKKGHKYVIGKKLDLSFLKDIYVKVDGELKVHVLSSMHWNYTNRSSLRMISRTGKPTTSTTRSRKASHFGSGVESK
jgi:galacturan 1,4-alpha-galacturonidase